MNKIKEEIFKIDSDYLDFRLKDYRVLVLKIDNNKTAIEIRKGKKDKILFYEEVKGGIYKNGRNNKRRSL